MTQPHDVKINKKLKLASCRPTKELSLKQIKEIVSINKKRNVRKGHIHPAGLGVCMFVQVPNSFSDRSNPQTNQGRQIPACKLAITLLTPQSMSYLIAGKGKASSLQDNISNSKPQSALQLSRRMIPHHMIFFYHISFKWKA